MDLYLFASIITAADARFLCYFIADTAPTDAIIINQYNNAGGRMIRVISGIIITIIIIIFTGKKHTRPLAARLHVLYHT